MNKEEWESRIIFYLQKQQYAVDFLVRFINSVQHLKQDFFTEFIKKKYLKRQYIFNLKFRK